MITSFYSFKGGVGRSALLANVAMRLLRRPDARVVLIDFDLEAPGLHQFLGFPSCQVPAGVLEWLLKAQEHPAELPPLADFLLRGTDSDLPLLQGFGPRVQLVPAGAWTAASNGVSPGSIGDACWRPTAAVSFAGSFGCARRNCWARATAATS